MEKILILGAGVYQVPLIRKCKELGYETIVASVPGNYPGFACADKVYYESTVDKEAILKLAKEEGICAILTTGTDVAVSTIGYVCDELGLTGVSSESALWATDKLLMKEKLSYSGVRTADFCRVSSLEEAKSAFERMGAPLMFKCVDMSGSRGIIKVENESEVDSAFQYAMGSAKRKDYIIVERFLEGYEIGVDGYVGDGEGDVFIAPHDKLVHYNGATSVPIGHKFPFVSSDRVRADVECQIKRAVEGLNFKHVFFNADVMICGNESYIIEIGARCGATCIPELISLHYDVDYYGMMVKNSLGQKIEIPQNPSCASIGQLIMAEQTGLIEELRVDEMGSGVDDVVFDYGVGDYVEKFRVGPDRIGHIIVCGKDVDEAQSIMDEAKKHIHITIRQEK